MNTSELLLKFRKMQDSVRDIPAEAQKRLTEAVHSAPAPNVVTTVSATPRGATARFMAAAGVRVKPQVIQKRADAIRAQMRREAEQMAREAIERGMK